MPDRPCHDLHAELETLIEPIARGARLALLLDERQPDAVRAAALAMTPERLFWTLTQLDDGLSLDVCQALVRAARLGRGRPFPPDRRGSERWSAEAAGMDASVWLARRLAALPAAAEVADWLDRAGRVAPPASGPAGTAGSAAPGSTWLDLPPVTGPPPGADDPSLAARLLDRIQDAWRRR